jgi:regulator of RNase E activity RraA
VNEPGASVDRPDRLTVVRDHLGSALVADALDALGRRHCTLGPRLVPLELGGVVAGRAFPVSVVRPDVVPEIPYQGLLRALDALGPGDMWVISSGGTPDAALWGELLSTVAMRRGAVGALCDGYVRDTGLVRRLGFPVFSHGSVPLDIHGRLEVVGHGEPLEIDEVVIHRGDLVVADDDGVVVVPADVEEAAIARALEKAAAEDGFRAAVSDGMLPSQAWEIHRVL